MATPRWIGAALPVKQKDSITIANTWATSDTLTVTIGIRDLTLTVGAATATSDVAAALIAMINGTSAVGTETRSETGNNVPEFAEVTASLFSASVVHVTANTAGRPFTMTATESTAGTGTATRAAVTACTGPNFFDNADNWDTGAVPVDADTIYIDNSDVSILYGLDQSAVEPAAMYIAMSYTGQIGLPEVNAEGGYHEYRSTYLSIGPVILHIGGGPGAGSGRIKINSTSDACALTVLASGASVDTLPTIIWKGTNAANALVQVGGSLGVGVFGGETATLATITKNGGDLICGTGVTLSGALVHTGGSFQVNSLIDTSLTQTGGTTIIDGTANVDQLTLRGGLVVYNTSGTLGGATVISGDGTLDLSQRLTAVTITNPIDLYGQASIFNDPHKRAGAVVVDLNEGATVAQVGMGINIRLTRGTPA